MIIIPESLHDPSHSTLRSKQKLGKSSDLFCNSIPAEARRGEPVENKCPERKKALTPIEEERNPL